MKAVGILSLVAAALFTGVLDAQENVKQVSVNGTKLYYVEQGTGAPVVFVHGAISDHRTWDGQREAIGARYRFIALDRRYFGRAPWPDSATHRSLEGDAADLAAFIRELQIAPAFVVGSSGGAVVALLAAVRYPELIRGLFVHEGGIGSLVTNSADRRQLDASDSLREAPKEAAATGNATEAVRLFLQRSSGVPVSLDTIPPRLRTMFMENARTLTLPNVAPTITCANLSQIRIPVTISRGEFVLPAMKKMTDIEHRCISQSQLVTIPSAGHGAHRQNAVGFNSALLEFLSRN